MTVAVSCNISEGVILGVDSAVTVPSPEGGVVKVFENAEKLFQLGDRPIGIAIYGIAGFENRGIGSFIREFELKDPEGVIENKKSIGEVVEQLRNFFYQVYNRTVVPIIEDATKTKLDSIPIEKLPVFGLVIGGFSDDSYLSEVWNVVVPLHKEKNTAIKTREQGSFGTNWFATFEPIRRYIKGYDPRLIDQLIAYTQQKSNYTFSENELQEIGQIINGFEYQIPFDAMPLEEGVAHTRFLVELAINHHRYAIGAPIVGGKVNIGKVTYNNKGFEILKNTNHQERK